MKRIQKLGLIVLAVLLLPALALADSDTTSPETTDRAALLQTDPFTREDCVNYRRVEWEYPVTGRVVINDVTTFVVYVRSEPDQYSEKLGGLPSGAIFDCVGQADNGWNAIVLPSGRLGYVSGNLTRYKEGVLSEHSYSYPIGYATFKGSESKTYEGYCSTTTFDAKTIVARFHGGDVYQIVGYENGMYCLHNPDDGYLVYVSKHDVQAEYTVR